MKFRNLYLVLKDQLPVSRFIRNLLKGHMIGLFSKRSHENADGKPKICYGSKTSATKAAQSMMKKRGVYFSNYKCVHCDGFHIGKNSENKIAQNSLQDIN
jgi:hypothetical protein